MRARCGILYYDIEGAPARIIIISSVYTIQLFRLQASIVLGCENTYYTLFKTIYYNLIIYEPFSTVPIVIKRSILIFRHLLYNIIISLYIVMFCFWLVLPAAAVVGLKWSHFLRLFFLNRRWSAYVPFAVVRAQPAPHVINTACRVSDYSNTRKTKQMMMNCPILLST